VCVCLNWRHFTLFVIYLIIEYNVMEIKRRWSITNETIEMSLSETTIECRGGGKDKYKGEFFWCKIHVFSAMKSFSFQMQ
jgi:hypothetical protein